MSLGPTAATATRPVEIPAGAALPTADLTVPAALPAGVVAFAHGSGSGSTSPRNRAVGAQLVGAGLVTLLIVGGNDPQVLELNRTAAAQLPSEPQLETVSGASHQLEEPGTLERAATLTRDWFVAQLPRDGHA